MWHLSFIIPFVLAFVGLVALTVFLFNFLCDAIVDGTAKERSEKPGVEVVLQEDVVGTKMSNEVLPQFLMEQPAVAQKALQCTPNSII